MLATRRVRCAAAGVAELRRLVADPALASASGWHLAVASGSPTGSGAPGRPPYDGSGAAGGPADDPELRRVAALVTLAQGGDREAFAQVYDRYVTLVHNYLYYRTGSAQVAEDLTSETFLKALRRIDTFAWHGRDFGAWLVTIARNLATDHFRSASFRLEVPTEHLLEVDRPDDGIEDLVADRLQSVTLVEALRRLKPEQQECLVLRFLQGLTVAETARILDRSEGAVKQLQLRAVRSLAKLLPDGTR